MNPQTAGVFMMLLMDVTGELKACERGTHAPQHSVQSQSVFIMFLLM